MVAGEKTATSENTSQDGFSAVKQSMKTELTENVSEEKPKKEVEKTATSENTSEDRFSAVKQSMRTELTNIVSGGKPKDALGKPKDALGKPEDALRKFNEGIKNLKVFFNPSRISSIKGGKLDDVQKFLEKGNDFLDKVIGRLDNGESFSAEKLGQEFDEYYNPKP